MFVCRCVESVKMPARLQSVRKHAEVCGGTEHCDLIALEFFNTRSQSLTSLFWNTKLTRLRGICLLQNVMSETLDFTGPDLNRKCDIFCNDMSRITELWYRENRMHSSNSENVHRLHSGVRLSDFTSKINRSKDPPQDSCRLVDECGGGVHQLRSPFDGCVALVGF